jgi:hypothetical protein
MWEQFMYSPNYPVEKLVSRLKNLSEMNPRVRKWAQPLLDYLAKPFDDDSTWTPDI